MPATALSDASVQGAGGPRARGDSRSRRGGSHREGLYIAYPRARFYPAKLRRFVEIVRSALAQGTSMTEIALAR